MGDRSEIEWCDATWNPLVGCRRVSPGCVNCYAERQAIRMAGPGGKYEGIVHTTGGGPRWTGASRMVVKELDKPLRWKRPRRIFVDSMADLFFEGHSNEDIAAAFGVMAAAHWHTFQVLTKRAKRALDWFAWAHLFGELRSDVLNRIRFYARRHLANSPHLNASDVHANGVDWPLPNVWLGVSTENQEAADERIPLLLETPAAVRFVSYEPALGPVTFQGYAPNEVYPSQGRGWLEPFHDTDAMLRRTPRLDWIIAGSESGPRARPAELDWFRAARDQCAAAGVSFFFKQWVGPDHDGGLFEGAGVPRGRKVSLPVLDGRQHAEFPR